MSRERRWGVNLPLPSHTLLDHRPVIEQLGALGYHDVWTGEGLDVDALTPLAIAAGWAPHLRVGTGVLPVYTRGPAVLAQTAATLAEVARGGVLLGIGSSVKGFVRDANGLPFERPYARVRDTLRFLKGALRGDEVVGPAETIPFARFQLPRPAPGVTVIVGALRPRMLRLGFTEGDGAITNILLAEDVAPVVEAIDAPLEGKELVVKVFLCPTDDAAWVERVGRPFVTTMLNLPTYRGFHEWLGRGELLRETNARWEAGDVTGAQRALPRELLDGLFVHGTPARCREQLARFLHPAVTAVNLFVFPTPEIQREPARLPALLRELRPEE